MKVYGTGPVTGDNAQTLTPAQQSQARANIGAGTGSHAFFTGTSTQFPSISLGNTQFITLTGLTPGVSGDTLSANERIMVLPNVDLPQGVNIAFARAPATNTVRIGVTSSSLLSLTTTTVVWTIIAYR